MQRDSLRVTLDIFGMNRAGVLDADKGSLFLLSLLNVKVAEPMSGRLRGQLQHLTLTALRIGGLSTRPVLRSVQVTVRAISV